MTHQTSARGAKIALLLLTLLNLVNYVDRYVLNGAQELIKSEFHLSDSLVGALTTWFFITYTLAAPLTGWMGDRYPRKYLAACGVLLWSGTNLFTATVHSYSSLLVRHAALGIGEASFGIFAPALLADFYAPEQRNRVLTLFNFAVPVGSALGYALGGWLGASHGWRVPIAVSAAPGVLLAFCMLIWVREPERGAMEQERSIGDRSALHILARNKGYLSAVLGYSMVTFMIGGVAAWIGSFFHRFHGYSLGRAGTMVGAVTVLAGIAGTAAGGFWADRWLRTNHKALFYVTAWGALGAIPLSLLCFFGPPALAMPALFFAEFCIFLGNGPINAAVVNVVPASVRATALAGELFFLHFLGDAGSPTLIGLVSDHSNLRYGLSVTVIALLFAAAALFYGARFAPLSRQEHACKSQ